MIYAGTAIISLLLLPNKYPAVIYLFFAGLYPMVKSYSERLSMPVALIIKLLFTNAMLTVIILIAKYLLAVPDDELGLRVTVYIACNAMLIVFDYLLTQLITVYQKKIAQGVSFCRYIQMICGIAAHMAAHVIICACLKL